MHSNGSKSQQTWVNSVSHALTKVERTCAPGAEVVGQLLDWSPPRTAGTGYIQARPITPLHVRDR